VTSSLYMLLYMLLRSSGGKKRPVPAPASFAGAPCAPEMTLWADADVGHPPALDGPPTWTFSRSLAPIQR